MDKITEVFTTYRNPIYIGVAIVVILVVLYFVATRTQYLQFLQMSPQPHPHQKEHTQSIHHKEPAPGQEDFKDPQDPTKIIIFFAPWCPHCKNMMAGEDSVWERLKRKHGHRQDLLIDQVNCDEQPELATKFGVKGFPTIMKIKQDKVETFEGDRTLEALEGFIDS